MDAFSRKIVGWNLGQSLATDLPLAALQRAIQTRKPAPGLIHHSDRGIQYTSAAYVDVLLQHGIIRSMSRPANPYDNAKCERFMKTLKQEEIRCFEYRDINELQASLELFFDRYYNGTRLHSALGYKTPNAFEEEHASRAVLSGPKMSFRRHEEIFPPDVTI
jgi:transposase InsO family protein